MIILSLSADVLQIITSGAFSLDWSASYVDVNASTTNPAFAPGSTQGNISTATTTTIVAAGAAGGTVRQIKLITARNRDGTNTNSVTFAKNGIRLTGDEPLAPGEYMTYVDGIGFQAFDSNGRLKLTSVGAVSLANPTALVELTANNGVAGTAMRSDASPALDLKLLYQVNPRMYTQGGAL